MARQPGQLTPDPKNANTGTVRGLGMVERSLQQYGAGRSILASRDGIILAGNKTYDRAVELGIPVREIESDGTTLFVIKRTDLDYDDPRARELAIADNRTSEVGLEWDTDVLTALAEDGVDLSQFWFEDELAALLGVNDDMVDVSDDVMPPPSDPVTRAGDIWDLGDHRVMCGDATSTADRDRVLAGTSPTALIYDPPWDADVSVPINGFASTLAFADGRRANDIVSIFGAPSWVFVWDCVTTWYTPNRPLQRMKLCFWYGEISMYNFNGAFYGEPGEASSGQNSRGEYEYTPDPRGKHLADVYSQSIAQLHTKTEHHHSKPIDWIRCLIGTTSTGTVYDPFLGSGTSLIACEQLGRPCVGLEIDPGYCDVIVNRWESATGQTAVCNRNEV